MAHFAELESKTDPTGFTSDTHLIVKRVVVVANDEVPSDEHVDGETWCVNFFGGGIWKQTSYNHNFRKQYAGIGYRYDASKNKFLSPQPYASWSLDSSDDWQAPVTYPSITSYDHASDTYTQQQIDDNAAPEGSSAGDPVQVSYIINWDESNLRWTAKDMEDPTGSFRWDADNSQWVSL